MGFDEDAVKFTVQRPSPPSSLLPLEIEHGSVPAVGPELS